MIEEPQEVLDALLEPLWRRLEAGMVDFAAVEDTGWVMEGHHRPSRPGRDRRAALNRDVQAESVAHERREQAWYRPWGYGYGTDVPQPRLQLSRELLCYVVLHDDGQVEIAFLVTVAGGEGAAKQDRKHAVIRAEGRERPIE